MSGARIAVAVIAVSACSGGRSAVVSDAAVEQASPDAPSDGVSFATAVYPIIAASCIDANCHDGSRQMNHWSDFTTAASTYQRWVNGPGFDFCVDVPTNGVYTSRVQVVPGDPDASYLVMKLAPPTTAPCQDPTHHRQMPAEPRPPLPAASIETIVTWIREGARQN